ncbi:dnaJ [Symbiodinium natans]|uniref:DnaJ protein n=1 Tax=Symbiodinium natans TaxID=878477 RepID=A0A812NCM3_9DINO|nr:dnaJ [Symbiodinium natans]
MLQPHDVLQIQPGSNEEDVKAAYKRRALETHPDKGGDVEEFRAVRKAYEQLLKDSPARPAAAASPPQTKPTGVAPFPRGFSDLFSDFGGPATTPLRFRSEPRKRRRTLEESIDLAFASIPLAAFPRRPPVPSQRRRPMEPASPRVAAPQLRPMTTAGAKTATTSTPAPRSERSERSEGTEAFEASSPVAKMWKKLLELTPEKRKQAISGLPASAKLQLKAHLQAQKQGQQTEQSTRASGGEDSSSSDSSSSSSSEGLPFPALSDWFRSCCTQHRAPEGILEFLFSACSALAATISLRMTLFVAY